MASDEDYMREALALAKNGLGKTSPNPAVGAILVKNGTIIGRGYHRKAGEAHAEINALADAGDRAKGSTMYVTLEPCNHQGRTPPCTKAIIKAGVARVVAARVDPNPRVSGAGILELQKSGIDVKVGVLEDESKRMGEMYDKFITTGIPFVIVKAALSADGRMAARDGNSKWITGEEAREAARRLRAQVDAVLVGINTVLMDDPELTSRIEGVKNPKRIVLDPNLKIPLKAKVLNKEAETLIVATDNAPLKKIGEIEDRGKEVLVLGEGDKINLKNLMAELGKREITSVMIEGGGETIGSAFDEGIVDKVMFFIAPKIIGGSVGIVWNGAASIDDAIVLERAQMTQVGEDFLLIGYPAKK